MSRTGFLIVSALLFALAAAAVLVWTNVLDVASPTAPTSTAPTTAPTGPSEVAKWNLTMNQVEASGGLAVTFGDSNIQGWLLPAGHKLERFTVEGGQAVFARLTSSVPVNDNTPTWAERGLSYSFPVEFAAKTNGARVEIGVIAKSASTNGSETLNIVYATQQAGNSGWQQLALTSKFQLLTFTYDVPSVPEGYSNPPMVVLHSDPTGSGHAVEIVGLYAKPLPAQ